MLRLAWLAPLLILWAASSPAIAQRTPAYLFPVLGVAGGGLLVVSLTNALVRLARDDARQRRRRLVSVAVNALATLALVVLPAQRFLATVGAPAPGSPRVLAGFGDWRGSEGYPRWNPHRGLDLAGRVGSDVLAAADGRVTAARDNGDLCGLIVAIRHEPHDYRTVYCHLATIGVKAGDGVKRGQPIGTLGTSGQRAWPGYEHVHWELQRGAEVRAVEDPRPHTVGCFDPARSYPADRLALTYPVRC